MQQQIGSLTANVAEMNRIMARLRRRVGTAGSDGIKLRGEWFTTPSDVLKNDMWIISAGATAGAYIALQDNPSVAPWIGSGQWDKISVLDTAALGAWT